jgi:hypothetical protein
MASLQSDLHNTTLPYLHLVDVLKHLPRTGWLRFVDHPESVAAHMYRMALIAMICAGRIVVWLFCHGLTHTHHRRDWIGTNVSSSLSLTIWEKPSQEI